MAQSDGSRIRALITGTGRYVPDDVWTSAMVEARVDERSGGWQIPPGHHPARDRCRRASLRARRRVLLRPRREGRGARVGHRGHRASRRRSPHLRVGFPRRRGAGDGQHGPDGARLRPRRGHGREERVQQLPQRSRRGAGLHRDGPRRRGSWSPPASASRRPSSGTSTGPTICRSAWPRSRWATPARRASSRRAPIPSAACCRGIVRVGRSSLGALDRARRRLPLRRGAGTHVLRVPEHEAATARRRAHPAARHRRAPEARLGARRRRARRSAPGLDVGDRTDRVARWDIPVERCMVTLDRFGNTAAASIPLALDLAIEEGRVAAGRQGAPRRWRGRVQRGRDPAGPLSGPR